MDGFTAVLLLWLFTLSLAFGAGRYLPMGDVAQEINTKGEIEIHKTIYQCKPVALQVDGRRLEIK
ncbi:hypothetical protein D3C85_1293070 [compost metagenome]